jgi:hypothetical protein
MDDGRTREKSEDPAIQVMAGAFVERADREEEKINFHKKPKAPSSRTAEC